MTAFHSIVETENEAHSVYDLIICAKKANKAKKVELIKMHLAEGDRASYDFRRELIHFLFSPLRTFNLKPKKEWKLGDKEGEKRWADAHALLLKLESREISGNAAKQAAEELCANLKPWSADLFKRCLEKRPDAGMTANTINTALPHFVPQFKCALAEPVDMTRADWPMLIQPKLDGVRVLAHVEVAKSKVTYYTRKGLTYSSMGHLTADCLDLARHLQRESGSHVDMMLDGEVFGENFKESISAVRKKDTAAVNTNFHVYDWMTASQFFASQCSMPQLNRTKLLKAAVTSVYAEIIDQGRDLKIAMVPTMICPDEAHAEGQFALYQEAGFEGAVLKKMNTPYSFRRSYDWMKMKSEASEDLVVIGLEEGTGKYERMLGALIVEYKGVQVRVGSGLTDELRKSLWGVENYAVGRVVEVEYMEVTPDGSLRHPRFVCFRDTVENPGSKI